MLPHITHIPDDSDKDRGLNSGVIETTGYLLQRHMATEAQTHASYERTQRQLSFTGGVQIDDAYWGGEKHGGKPGRGSENKHPFVAAVETNEENHPLSMRFSMVTSFRKKELELWAKKHLSRQTHLVTSDGLGAFTGIADAGHLHKAVVTGGGHESMSNELFTWVNTMIGNVKNSLRGSYHSINPKHLPRYLAEFCYRFNRRFDMGAMISRLGYMAARTCPMPERLLKLADL